MVEVVVVGWYGGVGWSIGVVGGCWGVCGVVVVGVMFVCPVGVVGVCDPACVLGIAALDFRRDTSTVGGTWCQSYVQLQLAGVCCVSILVVMLVCPACGVSRTYNS